MITEPVASKWKSEARLTKLGEDELDHDEDDSHLDTTDSESDLEEEDLSDEDFGPTWADHGPSNPAASPDNGTLSEQTKTAAYKVGHLVALSEDLESTTTALKELKGSHHTVDHLLILTQPAANPPQADIPEDHLGIDTTTPNLSSAFVSSNKVVVGALLTLRTRHQEGARVRSQRIFKLDPKFLSQPTEKTVQEERTVAPSQQADTKVHSRGPESAPLDQMWALSKVRDPSDNGQSSGLKQKLTIGDKTRRDQAGMPTMKEMSHRVRIAQHLHGNVPQDSSARLARWTEVLRGVQQRVPMLGELATFLLVLYTRRSHHEPANIPHIIRSTQHFYQKYQQIEFSPTGKLCARQEQGWPYVCWRSP